MDPAAARDRDRRTPMTMYLEHFGLREAPFRITPHTEFFFAGANRGATLEALVYAITAGEGLVKVTGEVGTGKTMLCRMLMERLPEKVETIYLAVPSLSRDEMLVAVASELKIDTDGATTTRLLRALQDRLLEQHAGGRQVVALIDEAHAMPLETLEEIRLLSNLETGTQKLLQIVLFGQPELDEHLALPHMRQLKERITHAFLLDPLPARDIRDYINFRLRAAGYHGPDLFGPEALRIIAEASEGLTRRINIYADKTLLAAFAAGTHSVTADHARAAVSDTRIVLTPPRPASHRAALFALAGLAAGVVIGFGLAHLFPLDSAPATAANVSARGSVGTAPPRAPAPAASAPVAAAPAAPPAAPPAASPEATAASPPPSAGTALSQAPSISALPATAKEPTNAQAKTAVPVPEPAVPPRLSARVDAGLGLLDKPGDGRFVVQLMMTDARARDHLEWYIAEATRTLPADTLFLYPSGSGDSPKLGVIYGVFASRREATEALEALPASLRQFRPYVRSVDAVRSDVRRGAPA
jgi:type II secretory pathway predicted ATPase ExeA